jgi:1-acyl-sn-glycerol-3-phosphate acyltransferase/MFS family permease
VWFARVRLLSLWLSQFTRLLADNCLRIFVILELAQAGARAQAASWHLVLALFIAPAIVFAPFNGAVSNSLPRRWVLVGTATYCLAILFGGTLLHLPWLVVWALLAVGSVIYYPTRYAVLPAAAEETHLPLTRVNGLVEMGAAVGIVLGILAGGHLENFMPPWEGAPPPAVALALACSMVSLLTALPVSFRGDVRRAEPAAMAVRGFFRDLKRIFAVREARVSLLAMAGLRGLVAAATGALLAVMLGGATGRATPELVGELIQLGLWIGGGCAVGSLVAGVQGNPRRALGLVPLSATGLALGLLITALTGDTGRAVCAFVGAMTGLANVPLAAVFQAHVPADARGNAMAVRSLVEYGVITLLALAVMGLTPAAQFWAVAVLAALGAAACWRLMYAQFLELLFELAMLPLYRIRTHGPGKDRLPLQGPLLVVANHSAWFDPLWIGKVMPRRVRPMMTSVFYDLPGLRWLMKYVVEAIRVQYSRYRREAPELREAIAALDQGQCVIIFPEGALRRLEEKPLKQFGQGVWHILQERPQTPVVVCWIEGGWGSYCSYYNGPPTKNKRLDWFRHINIVVGVPQLLAPALLQDQRGTRTYLMQQCLETRRHLGLAEVKAEAVEEEEVGDTAG